MTTKIEISESDVKSIVLAHLQEKFPAAGITLQDLKIETKSKQNYRAEWETAAFRAVVDKHVSL